VKSHGTINALSVSQIETFDRTVPGDAGCELKWWFERKADLRPDSTVAQKDGTIGHDRFAVYFTTGEKPEGRVKMGKMVRGAIEKGELPKPGAHLLVEQRFSGQPQYTLKHPPLVPDWVPLDVEKTIKIAGIPLDGYIDLAWRDDAGMPHVWDHKFRAKDFMASATPADQLIRTVQMPVYVHAMRRVWPDAKRWEIAHHNVSKTGTDSKIHRAVVTVDQIDRRIEEITATVERMKVVARAESQDEVPFNRKACNAWYGCPHQSICRPYLENRVELTPEEDALFDDSVTPPAAAAAPLNDEDLFAEEPAPTPPPAVEEDEEAKALKALEAARQKKAAAAEAAKKAAEEKAAAEKKAAEEKAKAEAAKKAAEKKPKLRVDPMEHELQAPAESAPDRTVEGQCAECGGKLDANNASRLQGGELKHVGCPMAVVNPTQGDTKPARGKKVEAPGSITINVNVSPEAVAKLFALLAPFAK
jgi:hypothetical protein